jgi:hypothetical protein
VLVADGIEGVPPAMYLLVQELVALVSNNHVELHKSHMLAQANMKYTQEIISVQYKQQGKIYSN